MSSAIFPGANSWTTPRSDDTQITSSNCEIMFNKKIDKLNKVVINADSIKIHISAAELTTAFSSKWVKLNEVSRTLTGNVIKQLDITKYCVEKAEWDTLSEVKTEELTNFRNKYKNNTIFYEHNGNSLKVLYDIYKSSLGGGFPVFPMLIKSAIIDMDIGTEVYYEVHGKKIRCNIDNREASTNNDPRSAQFRIYYTPLGESVKLQVPKTNPQANQFCIPYSQRQPIVDNVSYGREMQSVANRAGCEKKEVVRTCHSIKEIRRPRDGWYCKEKDANGNLTGNIWRLTSAHYSIYSETYIIVKETWSKNWSYRSENVPINREFRSWKIPADIVQRNLLWQDYCLITRKDVTFPNEDPEYPLLLSDMAKTELMRGLDGSCSGVNTECNNMWFYNLDADGYMKGAVLSCSSFGFGNSLVFTGKTKDNLSAGVQRVDSENNGNYQFCKDVYYCNEDGTLPSMYIQISPLLWSSNTDIAANTYPECRTYEENNELIAENIFNPNYVLFRNNIPAFKVLKDPCEQLNFTYQLHLLTDDGFLVIGSTWAATNPLVKQRDKAQTIKVWKLTQPIPQGAQVMTTTYGTEQQSNLFAVNTSSGDPTITFNPQGTVNNGAGVCVTDEHNAVLIAFNSSEPATFHVKFTHNYTAIAKAIKH